MCDNADVLQICHLTGLTDYGKALDLQEKLQERRIRGEIGDVLLLLEHPPVLTLGTRGDDAHIHLPESELAAAGVTIHKVGRGGDVTYHGPGQIVGYPIMNIARYPGRIRSFVAAIEQAIIDLLAEQYAIEAAAGSGKLTGVWAGRAKICAIGLSIRQGVSMHGFAFNVNTDLRHFDWINPCGLSLPVTSLSRLLERPLDLNEVRELTGQYLARSFGRTPVTIAEAEVWQMAGLSQSQPERSGYLRKPEWLRVKANVGSRNTAVMAMLRRLNLHTVCEEALCPNCGSCFERKTAAFLILGDQCTRNCRFCSVTKGRPLPPDPAEPEHLAEACDRLELRHVVITSVTRDDLPDGGADHYVAVIRAIRSRLADRSPVIEVLIPDLAGNWAALRRITAAAPEIINHNVETIPRLYPDIRPGARYGRSLELLAQVRQLAPAITTKSGLMVGLGETEEEITAVLSDLRKAGCDMITIGQYLAPSRNHVPVVAYIEPARFDRYARIARAMGFRSVASGPLVRSSYMADQSYEAIEHDKPDSVKNIDAGTNQS